MPPKIEVSRSEVLKAALKKLGIVFVCIVTIAGMLGLMMTGGKTLGIHKPDGKDDQTLLQSYIEWYGVFFTLALSFIIGQGWRKYLRVNSEIDREIDALTLLVRTSEMLGQKHYQLTRTLVRIVILYVETVKSLTVNDKRTDSDTADIMRELHECIKDIVKERKVSDSIKQQLLQHYCEAYDARGDRFDLAAQKLPRIAWIILLVVSFTWLWGFVWLEFHTIELNLYISACTLGSVSFLFLLAWQLNNVTQGRFSMDFSSFNIKIIEENNEKQGVHHE
ncbi:MAG: DUF4239 domain-containing protein [candidate division KSB1 bacterium]|nr:DUF4239 domain-containing protein [candidate division KSB1 bacterium]MDZ7365923.1 DUF4239 domain-containing protein [candidate division KSB1 bacterium]MDZ7403843.1 DUF4239 domain-containing protein [candidate division KSB1 bacterium]